MTTRRTFLSVATAAGALAIGLSNRLFAQSSGATVKSATAITQVFGNGQRLTAVAIEYSGAIENASLLADDFTVAGRTVTRVYANTAGDLAPEGSDGPFVIVELSPDDADAVLFGQVQRDTIRKDAAASVTQVGDLTLADGADIPPTTEPVATTAVHNLIVDDFVQRAYTHPATGLVLNYNLFVPKGYDAATSYPLVLFMHDAGVTSDITNTTLIQGLGAISFASPEDQAKHPAFVLAPQYAEQVVDDESQATAWLDVTIDLVKALTEEFSIDQNRLYNTGQSGGGMMSIAMNIKYPDLFAASFLVACQWDATLCKPLADDKLWIVVSEGDLKAYPGQNAIMEVLEAEGAMIGRAVWNGRATSEEFAADVAAMEAEGNPIKYVALQKGTVVLPGQDDDGGSNHTGTWRIAYQIPGIRDWLLSQSK